MKVAALAHVSCVLSVCPQKKMFEANFYFLLLKTKIVISWGFSLISKNRSDTQSQPIINQVKVFKLVTVRKSEVTVVQFGSETVRNS